MRELEAFFDELEKIGASRSYMNDFLAGADPTGTQTFQYGMQDSPEPERESSLRQAVGTAGGALGGALLVPSAISGVIGGARGLASGGLRGGVKGLLRGVYAPFTKPLGAFRSSRGLSQAIRGKRVSTTNVRAMSDMMKASPIGRRFGEESTRSFLNAAPKEVLQKAQGVVKGELVKGVSALALSGAVGGASANLQYGKGRDIGKSLSRSSMKTVRGT